MPKPKEAKQKKTLVGKAPLGSLPAEKGQSAATTPHNCSIGDVVSFSLSGHTVAGEGTFIGHPKADKAGEVLVLAWAAEVGVELDADDCSPTGRSNPQRGREFRLRYFRNHPRGLEGNP